MSRTSQLILWVLTIAALVFFAFEAVTVRHELAIREEEARVQACLMR